MSRTTNETVATRADSGPIPLAKRAWSWLFKDSWTGGQRAGSSSSAHSRRVAREKQTIKAMLEIFCRDRHGPPLRLCADCQELLDYAIKRIEKCPFKEDKPACNACTIHCYPPRWRLRIKEVMVHAGPKMVLRHPILSLFHLLYKRKGARLHKRA